MSTVVTDAPDLAYETFPVAPLDELGSKPLAQALAAKNLAGILESLGFDVVIVPVALLDGVPQVRVFPSADSKPYNLMLFSSAANLDSFLLDSPERHFAIRHGVAMLDYIANHVSFLDNVVFDAAGPHSMRIPAAELAALLDIAEPDYEIDIVEQQISPDNITGYELPFDDLWVVIDLLDSDSRDDQIRRFIRSQTKSMGHEAATARAQLKDWLTKACQQAASNEGRQLAFLTAHDDHAAASLNVTYYWHFLGPQISGVPHLERLTEHLSERLGPDDQLLNINLDDGRILRHSRTRAGHSGLGADQLPLLMMDYWIPAPDTQHIAQIAFSTPMVQETATLLRLADNFVLNGQWATRSDDSPDTEDE
jgi:hypothetical protein